MDGTICRLLPSNHEHRPLKDDRPLLAREQTISCWRRFPAISGEGRRDWLELLLGSLGSATHWCGLGCDWAETLSARPRMASGGRLPRQSLPLFAAIGLPSHHCSTTQAMPASTPKGDNLPLQMMPT